MGTRVAYLSIDESLSPGVKDSNICINFNTTRNYTDEFEVPYRYEVQTHTRKGETLPDAITIIGIEDLYEVIDNEDCLPDVGLLDYKDEDFKLDLKDVTLRELYKEVLNKLFA